MREKDKKSFSTAVLMNTVTGEKKHISRWSLVGRESREQSPMQGNLYVFPKDLKSLTAARGLVQREKEGLMIWIHKPQIFLEV